MSSTCQGGIELCFFLYIYIDVPVLHVPLSWLLGPASSGMFGLGLIYVSRECISIWSFYYKTNIILTWKHK